MPTYTPTDVANFARQVAQLDAILSAGTLRVDYGDGKGSVQYRSIDEIRQVRSDIQAKLDSANNIGRTVTRRVTVTSRGGW